MRIHVFLWTFMIQKRVHSQEELQKMYENEKRIEELNQRYNQIQKKFWSNGL
ncbi:hypothetical protein JCM19038_3983 [Geomicrobium sp. JCM 19038]|nr:hypothetical protein JCM19038_3983 [Geomicrobium sp. JCM 19038]